MPSIPSKTLMIAEVGMNHDGSFGNALRLIDLAADCGADVVKFQTHLADAETLPDAPSPPYFQQESRWEYFRRTAFAEPQWIALKAHADTRNIQFMSSVFSQEAVELLERVGVAAYKVPSGEVTNLPLLEYLARLGKPVYLSSGMSSWQELDAAVQALQHGGMPLTVMQCTSEYPCRYEHIGLNVLRELRERYGTPVGLSDHTMTNYAAFTAVSLGARVIEKHLTCSRRAYGSDAAHSLEPSEFQELVQGIRAIETMLASPVDKDDLTRLRPMKAVFEKSLVAKREIAVGTQICEELLIAKKPGTGIPVSDYRRVAGRRVRRTIPAGAMLRLDDLEADGRGSVGGRRD